MLTKPDLTYLKEMSGGDKGLMTEIFDIYLEQVPEFIEEFKTALAANDYHQIYMTAHKAKTSVAIVGFNLLSAELKKLETSAKNNFGEIKPYEAVNAVIACLLETVHEVTGIKNSL